MLRFTEVVDAVDAGRSLGVDVVLEGRVRRAADQSLVVTTALHVVDDGLQLWGRRFVTDESRILDLAAEIGAEVARALTAPVAADQLGLPPLALAPPDAATLYLRARRELQATWDTGVDLAAAALADAALLAPDDPRIAATLATARARQAFWAREDGPWLAAARSAAERAIQLAPTLAEAWYAASMVRRYEGDVAGGAAALARALAFSPGLAAAHEALGGVLLEAGHLEDAIAHLEAARRIDPDSPVVPFDLPRAFALRGEWDRAAAYLERLPTTGVTGLRRALVTTRLRLWQTGAAIHPLPPGFAPQHPSETEVIPAWARIYRSGRLDPADLAVLDRAASEGAPRLRIARRQFLAEIRVAFGDPAGALSDITAAVALGLHDLAWLRRCPLFEPIRSDPAFIEAKTRVRERAAGVLAAVAR